MRVYALQPLENALGGSEIEAKLARTLKPHTTPVVTSAVDATSSLLATGGADGVVKVWDLRGGYTTHTFHGHSGVISALHFFQVDASLEEKPTTKSRKRKSHQDVAESVQDAATAGFRLASGGEDGKVRIWDLHKRKRIAVLDSHASVVRSLDFSTEENLLLSGSRDKTAILWDARTWQLRQTIPVLEELESAGFIAGESLFYTGGERARIRLWSVETGNDITEEQQAGSEIEAIVSVLHYPNLPFVLSVHADQTLLIHSLSPLKALQAPHAPPTLLPPLEVLRRIPGTHDEVIDLAYIAPDRNILALATNSEDIRLINISLTTDSSTYFGANVALLKGHTDIIITLAVDWSGHWLATGAKDNTAKLWRLNPAKNSYTCHATFTGHAESIGAIALPSSQPPAGSKEYAHPLHYSPKFVITGSQDKTVKRWDTNPNLQGLCRAAYTRKAHDKDINAIATSFSHTSPLFASASQDRTVKIWDVETGETIGVLRGHKRGVWSVAFSPLGTPALTNSGGASGSTARGMVVTGSGDKTVKIWNLSDYSCLRTLEGHANSVLKVVWLPPPHGGKDGGGRGGRGVQVASAAGDGLVKVWDAQAGECATTLDNHIDRVWALGVRPQRVLSAEESSAGIDKTAEIEKKRQVRDADMVDADVDVDERDDDEAGGRSAPLELVSGSADSTLTFWTDTSAATAAQATSVATARIERDQELQNHIRGGNYREGIVLALQMGHPKRLLDLFAAVVNGEREVGSWTGKKEVDEVIASLSDGQLWSLLQRVRDWNAVGRTSGVAQRVLYAVLRLVPKERLLNLRKRRKSTQLGSTVDEGLADAMADLTTEEDGKGRSKESVKDVLDGLKAYTERHYARLERTAEERFVLLWAVQQMSDVGMGGEEGRMVENGFMNGHELAV